MKIYWKLFIAFWLVSFLLSSSAMFLGRVVGNGEDDGDELRFLIEQRTGGIAAELCIWRLVNGIEVDARKDQANGLLHGNTKNRAHPTK